MSFVYWIHLTNHTDVFSEGYVGVTERSIELRFKEHKALCRNENFHLTNALNKYADDVVVSCLCVCSTEYAYWLEERLRPTKGIGWNIQKGGFSPPNMRGTKRKKRTRIKGSAEHRERVSQQMRDWWAARSEEDRKKLTLHLQTAPKRNTAPRKRGRKDPPETIQNKTAAQRKRAMEQYPELVASAAKMRQKVCKTPWLISDARKDVWITAGTIFDAYTSNPDLKFFEVLRKCSEFILAETVALRKRIEGGWNPHEDPLWLEWAATYGETNASSII